MRYGATPQEWAHWDLVLGLTEDLLPVVSNPNAQIAPESKMKDLGKVPSLYRARDRKVVGIKGWTERRSNAAQIGNWMKEEDYGVCIQTRLVRAIDVDVDDADDAHKIFTAIENAIGSLPLRHRTNSGKFLLAFMFEGQLAKRRMVVNGGAIELLGTGQQFIASGTHKSGVPYRWGFGYPDEIPTLTIEQINALWDLLRDRFAIEEPHSSELKSRQKGEHLDVEDPVRDWLEANWQTHGYTKEGLVITCPWSQDHTADTDGGSSTVWLVAGTNSYPHGHFKCLHAHCDGKSDQAFFDAIGYVPEAPKDFPNLDEEKAGEPEFPNLEGEAPPKKRNPFTPIPIDEFVTRPPPGWWIKHTWPQADIITTYGASGAGKSFVVLDQSLAIARGVDWRGMKVKQGRVVYIAAEGAGGFKTRIQAYCQYHNVDVKDLRNAFAIIEKPPNFLSADDGKQLIEAIRASSGADIVVVDTFAQVTAGGDENAAKDMGQAMKNCRLLGDATGATVVVIHHSGKDASKGARGWSGLKGAADAEFEVTKGLLRNTKQKDARDGSKWGFKLVPVTVGMDEDDEEITSCVVVEADPELAEDAIWKPVGKYKEPLWRHLLAMREDETAGVQMHALVSAVWEEMLAKWEEKPAGTAGKEINRDTIRKGVMRAAEELQEEERLTINDQDFVFIVTKEQKNAD